ncbi:MAG: hypothetical protein AAF721_29135 [Myxococcota bacterium]
MRRVGTAQWVLLALAALTWLSIVALDLDVEALHSVAAARRATERMVALARGFVAIDLSAEALARCSFLAAETLAVAVVGTALGAAAAVGLALAASAAVGRGHASSRIRRAIARALLDTFRAIPDFAWALILLVPLGPGPVTGALAIAVTVSGVLGRTYSQLIDAVPAHEVQSVEHLAGTGLGAAAYGRWPRIAAAGWSYTLVRLECSIRNASVIGVVGGGGIGAELFEELGYGRDDRVATLLVSLLVLTAAADLAATWTRQRLAAASGRARNRRLVLRAVAVAITGSVVWLAPAAADVIAGLTIDDGGFAASSLTQLLQPDLSWSTLRDAASACVTPLALAWLATVASTALALALLPWSSTQLTRRRAGLHRSPGAHWVPLVVTRGAALIARAVPDVAWLLLLAAAFRVGHLAAAIALLLHSTGVLVRTFSEAVDDRAVRDRVAGPGGMTARLAYRIEPQIRPTLITHASLQGESNLRAAFVLGILGAGGLGDAFHTAMTYWHLPQASTYSITMIVLFVIVDRCARRLSASSRRRQRQSD